MSAANYNISIERNATFDVSLALKDGNGAAIDVTNATIDAEIKQDYYFPSIASFTVTKITPASGIIELSLTPNQTANLHVGSLKYDVFAQYSNGVIQKILKGAVSVDENVTTL